MKTEIKNIMAEIALVRREYREEADRDKRARHLLKKEVLWRKIAAVDVAEGRPLHVLLDEVNSLYARHVGDRAEEAVVAVQLRLLWHAIEKRRGATNT
jgi:hypothetical protein